MERETQLRLRSLLSTWDWLLVILLIIGLSVGGWATYTSLVDQGTTENVSETEVWSVQTSFTHQAEVTVENPVFANGTVLRNRSTYLTTLSPTFEGSYQTIYQSQTDDPLQVVIERELLIQAEGEEQVFWTNRTSAGPPVQKTLDPGESVAATVELNATEFDQRRDAIVESIGSTPGDTSLALAFSVSASGTVDGDPTQISFSDQVPITVGGDSYEVGQGVGSEEAITQQSVTQEPIQYGPLMQIGGPLLALISLILLLLLAVGLWHNAFELTDREQTLLEYASERSEFDEWIVTTTVPDSITEGEAAEAETLTDVVDFAIDSDVAALEDTDSKAIYAVGSDVTVVYHPPRSVTSPMVGVDEKGIMDRLRAYYR